MKAKQINTGTLTYSTKNPYYYVGGTNKPNCTKHAMQCVYNYSDKFAAWRGAPYYNTDNKSIWNTSDGFSTTQYRSEAERGDVAIFAWGSGEHVAFVSEVHSDYLVLTEQNWNEGKSNVYIRHILPKTPGVNDYRGRKLIGFKKTYASGKITAKQIY